MAINLDDIKKCLQPEFDMHAREIQPDIEFLPASWYASTLKEEAAKRAAQFEPSSDMSLQSLPDGWACYDTQSQLHESNDDSGTSEEIISPNVSFVESTFISDIDTQYSGESTEEMSECDSISSIEESYDEWYEKEQQLYEEMENSTENYVTFIRASHSFFLENKSKLFNN